MGKLILKLLGKFLIGMLKIVVIFYIICKVYTYVSNLYGNFYGFMFYLIILVIIVVVANRIKQKRHKVFLENPENYMKHK